METIFLNAAGQVLFTRADMESGHWVQQEMTVNADYPYIADKVIQRGMRIAFRDPATDILQVFEIRNVQTTEPEHYQQIAAEHICISELQDEHINDSEITDKTAAQALATVLHGTGWAVGTNTASGTSSGDVGRGSVWNAVSMIQGNWNVYITPRVVISSAGQITGKFLDISLAQGTWRGVHLTISKNLHDASVTYDDQDVLTALYGYGGNINVPQGGGAEDKSEELTFSGVTWAKTADHPAKPAGQTYLEWPEKTALYGRAGRPRFGYYQNSDIESAEILLQKTWEALKRTAEPKINITGTCADLYRLGYADQPLRLHDTADIEIAETGEVYRKEIIMLDVDLVDPTGNRPEIGDYIPNIVYINRAINESASGTGGGGGDSTSASGAGGGGGGRGQNNGTYRDGKHYAEWIHEKDKIGMVVGTWNGGYKIKAGEITLAINDADESIANIEADHVNISATQHFHSLAGDIEHDADGRLVLKNAGGVYVQKTESGVISYYGVWDEGNLTGGVIVDKVNGQTTTYISGDKINISATDQIQTVSGAMGVDADGNLYIKNGGGFKLLKNGAYYGVWDEGNLTGGIIVDKVNGQTTTKIAGNVINVGDVINIINAGGQSLAKISADQVDINGSSVTISADRLNINGIIEKLEGKSLGVGSLTVEGQTNTQNIYAEGAVVSEDLVRANGGLNVEGSNAEWHSLKIDNVEAAKFLGTGDVNFDKAAAKAEGAAAVRLSSQGWQSGGRNVVTATYGGTSTGQSYTVNLPAFSTSESAWSSDHKKSVYFSTGTVSGPLKTVVVDASDVYQAGYTAGQSAGSQEAYNQGWTAGVGYAYNHTHLSGNVITGPNESGTGTETWYTITAGVSGEWTAGGGFSAHGYAYVNNSQVASAHKTYT